MYRGLHFKIILIFVIFSITIMLSLGAVMIVGAFNYYKEDFSTHMTSAFDENSELVGQLTSALDEDDSVARQKEILRAYATSIGLSQYRNFYILSTDGEFLDGSDVAMMDTLGITPNILAAMRGEKGDGSRFGTGYIDYAAYLSSGENGCIIYVIDSQQDARDFMTMVLSLLGQALIVVMILAIALSFFLAKAITSPIRKLTDIAKKISDGNYEENADIVANDEIGTLSDTINNMKDVIKTTLDQKTSEQRKFETLFVYLYDAVIVFDRRGSMMHINRMARKIFHMPKTGTETILEPFNFAQMIKILGIDYEGASKEYTEKKNVVFRDVIIEEKAYDVTFAEFKYAD
ncbi:MAG: HAMP domain-containing protein, partial [Clostridia bacterium]|nr:HAMP domain-containing protein [Clostridia bacterium]